VCLKEGLGVIPWSPLRGGWLSGRYRRGMTAPPSGSRVEKADEENWSEKWANYDNEHTWNLLDTVFAIAEETGKSVAQVSLNWLLQRPGVTAPIIGVRTLAHLEDNLNAAGWTLTAEQMERLNTASAHPLPYPYDFIVQNGKRD
jgi:aryl-alcohol dehydrogenase-like predicted oxidoreductase